MTTVSSNMESSLPEDKEAQMPDSDSKRGGWITFFFIIGTGAGLTIGGQGWLVNLIVYLIREFHIRSINAAQVSNVVNGCVSLFPVIGAIIADTVGCSTVIAVSSTISMLGIFLLGVIAFSKKLAPPSCEIGSSSCANPSALHLAVLYTAIALGAIGLGSTRFTTATMGANQFDKPKEQDIFFNWYFFTLYTSSIVSAIAIVYVEDNVSWALGFTLCFAANAIGLAIFLSGKRFFRNVKPQGSPFVGIARVIVAAIQKRNVTLPTRSEDFHLGNYPGRETKAVAALPTNGFRCLNKAAVKTEGDVGSNGTIARPWRLCTVQQVEDVKTIMRMFPLWSTSLFLATPTVVQYSLIVIQALTMDRHIGCSFKIPAGSLIVVVYITSSVSLSLINRVIFPTWQKLTGRYITSFQRIGIGHCCNILSMVVSALVERRRLNVIRTHHLQTQPGLVVPMLALWLFPQLIVIGVGESFHFPGQVALYYQEFPKSLRNTATAMIATIIGISFYLGAALLNLVRRVTPWLPDNINNGRLDNLYWTVAVVGLLNFGYYLTCAKLYKHQNGTKEEDDETTEESAR